MKARRAAPDSLKELAGPLWALGAACVMALLFLTAWIGAELVLWTIGR